MLCFVVLCKGFIHKCHFFKKDLLHRKSVRYTGLRNCSFNQFALVVPRRASDGECTVLGSYEYSSEKQVQRKITAEEKQCGLVSSRNLCTEQSPKESDDTRCCVNTIVFLKMSTVVLH